MSTESTDSESYEMMCMNCQSEEALLWCKKCEANYCPSCNSVAHSQPIWKTHVAVPIDQKPTHWIACDQHPEEKLKFWCKNCMTLVCRDCIIVLHYGHTCTTTTDIAQAKASELTDWFSKTKLSLDQSLQKAMEIPISNENDTVEMLTKVFESIRSTMTDHENELKTKIRAIEEHNNNLVQNFQTQLKDKQEETTRRSREYERILSMNNHSKLLQDHKTTIDYLETTIQDLSKLKFPVKAEYRIVGVDQLQESLAEILRRVCVDDWQPAPLRSSPTDIHSDATWTQQGITVAGGNGQGSGIDQLYNPRSLCVDEDLNIYIADQENHRIIECKPGSTSGQVVAGGRGPGRRSYQLNNPYDVIIQKETGSIIIPDYSNKRIVRWPRRNGTSGEIILSNICCTGVAFDENGFLYVVDYTKNEVRRHRIGDIGEGVVVAGGNGQGNRLDQLSEPWYIFVDRDNSVYISDHANHRVMKWEEDAKEGIVVAGGQGQGNDLTQLSHPYGVVVDQMGTVYVADQGNHRIMRWPKGATQGSVILGGNGQGEQSNQFSSPWGLSFDRHGNLYVVDKCNYRVQKFNIDSNS